MLNATDVERLKQISIEWLVSTGLLPKNSLYWRNNIHAENLYDLYILYQKDSYFSHVANISLKTVQRIQSLCEKIKEQSWPLCSDLTQGKKEDDEETSGDDYSLLMPIPFKHSDDWISFFSNPTKVADNIKVVSDLYIAMPENTRNYLENSYRDLLGNNIRLSHILNGYSLIDFVTTFLTKPDEYVLKFRNIGKKAFEDYKSTKREFVLLLAKTFPIVNADEWISFFSDHKKVSDSIKAVSDYYASMPEATKDCLESSYRNLLRNRVRLFNILGKYSVLDFITTFLTEPDEYLLKFRNIGRKTFEEYKSTKRDLILLLSKTFYDFNGCFLGELPSSVTTELVEPKDEAEELLDSARVTYGNVIDEFVQTFVLEHGHLPMFYLIHRCLSLTKKHAHNKNIIDSLFEQDFSVSKYSDEHNITRSAVSYTRNSLRNQLGKFVASSDPNDWHYLLERLYKINWLESDSPLIREIQKVEHSTFGGESILHIISLGLKDDFILYNKHELTRGRPLIIKKSLTSYFDFKRFKDDFAVLYMSSLNEYTLNLKQWIESLDYFRYNANSIDKIFSVASHIVESDFDLQIDEQGNIHMPITAKVDTVNAVFEILNDNGKPMTLGELFIEFKKRFPSHKYTDANQLRSSLQRSDEIDAIGKRSTYALKKWTDISKGTIRSHIIEILNKSDTPLHIEKITEYVMMFYPDTNEKNVMSTIVQSDKFTRFKGSLVGLATKDYPVWYSPVKGDTLRNKTFEERLVELEAFIKEKGRLPSYNAKGDETEASLGRWYRRTIRNKSHPTPEQMEQLNEIVCSASNSNGTRAENLLRDFLPDFSFSDLKSSNNEKDADIVK